MDIETEIETTLIKKVNGKKHNIFKIPKKILFSDRSAFGEFQSREWNISLVNAFFSISI